MTEIVKERVRTFIVENFLFGDASQAPADDESLIENDVIDSTGVLELVAFIEESFGLTMADGDIVPANLDTLERIAAFVSARATAAEAAE
ncbi:MAG: acyl carrier protein [Aquamicrobium sp.]|uniref:acyl carrier protein n=1 Tax=Aquamicrobium sp. TaxID=1872579 RepID=UPI00349EB00B|nr:acyl carrier protein [Aquamicrobium sp.]